MQMWRPLVGALTLLRLRNPSRPRVADRSSKDEHASRKSGKATWFHQSRVGAGHQALSRQAGGGLCDRGKIGEDIAHVIPMLVQYACNLIFLRIPAGSNVFATSGQYVLNASQLASNPKSQARQGMQGE